MDCECAAPVLKLSSLASLLNSALWTGVFSARLIFLVLVKPLVKLRHELHDGNKCSGVVTQYHQNYSDFLGFLFVKKSLSETLQLDIIFIS